MTSRDEDREPDRQATGIVVWLARVAAEYGALPVREPRSADETTGHGATGRPG